MTDTPKRRKLSHEILGLIAIAAVLSLIMFLVLSGIATGVTEEYIFNHDIPMDEFDWIAMYQRIYTVAAVLSCIAFSVLFLAMMQSRIAYIQTITEGISQLQEQPKKLTLPLKGHNELKFLAEAVNDMSQAQLALREQEQALAQEKEQLIRALSHDIRTPLTSILAYSDYLTTREEITPAEQKNYLGLIRKKAEQIRDLTAILLDGSKRNLEYFDDGKLLMEQIVEEFQEELEEEFTVTVDFSGCPAFSGSFDVQELRRIFDNLSSNVRKYADPAKPVTLSVGLENGALLIRQINAVLPEKPQSESYKIGLNSIRRIAQHYGGSVAVEEKVAAFSITVMLSQI